MRSLSVVHSRQLATFAFVTMASWVALVLILHVLKADRYDPASQAMSELALGDFGYLKTLAFTMLGLGILSLALARSIRGAVVGPVLLGLASVGVLLSAVFEASATGQPATTESILHEFLGVGSFLPIMAAMFVFSWRFQRDVAWRRLSIPTLVWTAAAVATFLLVPLLGDELFGVAQRLFVATWLSWLLTVAVRVRAAPLRRGAAMPA